MSSTPLGRRRHQRERRKPCEETTSPAHASLRVACREALTHPQINLLAAMGEFFVRDSRTREPPLNKLR